MAALRYPRQEKFAHLIVKSPKTGMTIEACYRAAGYATDGASARACSSRLLTAANVRLRINEIMMPAVRKAKVTIESLLDELETTIRDARKDNQHSVVIAALKLMADLRGLLRERIEVGGAGAFDRAESTEEIAQLMLDDQDLDASLKGLDDLREALILAASNRAQLATPGVTNRGKHPKSLR